MGYNIEGGDAFARLSHLLHQPRKMFSEVLHRHQSSVLSLVPAMLTKSPPLFMARSFALRGRVRLVLYPMMK